MSRVSDLTGGEAAPAFRAPDTAEGGDGVSPSVVVERDKDGGGAGVRGGWERGAGVGKEWGRGCWEVDNFPDVWAPVAAVRGDEGPPRLPLPDGADQDSRRSVFL